MITFDNRERYYRVNTTLERRKISRWKTESSAKVFG